MKSFFVPIGHGKNSYRNVREERIDSKNDLKNNETWNWGTKQEEDIEKINQMLTEGPCLAHYEKDKDNKVIAEATTTGLEITLFYSH